MPVAPSQAIVGVGAGQQFVEQEQPVRAGVGRAVGASCATMALIRLISAKKRERPACSES